jgi:hypothetical protein
METFQKKEVTEPTSHPLIESLKVGFSTPFAHDPQGEMHLTL